MTPSIIEAGSKHEHIFKGPALSGRSKGHLAHMGEGGTGRTEHVSPVKSSQWLARSRTRVDFVLELGFSNLWVQQDLSIVLLRLDTSMAFYCLKNIFLRVIFWHSVFRGSAWRAVRLRPPKLGRSGFKFELCHFLAVCLRVSHLTSLILDFPMHQMEIMTYSMY